MEHIFKWFTDKGDGKALIYVLWFKTTFKPKDFSGINAVLACFIIYCAKLNVVPCYRFLQSYLDVDGMADIKANNIKLDDMDVYDYDQLSQLMEAYEVIKQVTLASYEDFMSEDLGGRNFRVDIYEFMKIQKTERITNAIVKAMPALSDGSDVDIVSDNLRSTLHEIDSTYNLDRLDEVDDEDTQEVQTQEFICKTGIPAVDEDLGGIYEHLIITLNAQPSGGKTRMSLVHFIYPVLTVAKKDVILYATELTKAQVENILIAYHIAQRFGKKVPDALINKGLLTEEQQRLVDTARVELFESNVFGKLHIFEECIVENLKEEVYAIAKVHDVKLICIDYMGLIESHPLDRRQPKLQGYEVISEGYKVVRRIVKKLKAAALCVNQFNEQGIDAAYAGKTIKSGYVQGGHISNRHTDYDLSLTYTEEQKLANMRTLANTKTRGTEGFRPVQIRTDLSVSLFRQEVKQ